MNLNGCLNKWSINPISKQEVCELGYKMYDCHMDHMHNCHHDGYIGHVVTPESLKKKKYFCNSGKVLYIAFKLEKIETKEDVESFSIGISSVEMQKYLNLNYNYSNSKNMETINSLDSTHPSMG